MTDKTPDQRLADGETIGHFLQGTCASLAGALEAHGMPEGYDNDSNFCTGLDNVAMECSCCGWWFEPCDLDDAMMCHDQCSKEGDDA